MLNRRFLIILCLSGFIAFISSAQRQSLFFYGKVVDRVTRQPIGSANIRFTGTETGTSTNAKGEFSFFIDTIPVYMMVSHLGYETQRIWLDNTSASIQVLLRTHSTMLKEVEIKSTNEPRLFFKDRHYSVLDFEVDSNEIYLLIYRYRLAVSELLCMNLEGDTLSRSGSLPFRPTGLFRDCLGHMHVLSADSAFQVFRDSLRLTLIYPSEMSRFRYALSNCVASAGDLLFFKKLSRDGMGVEFFAIHKHTRKRQQVTETTDKEKRKMLHLNADDYALLMRDRIPDGREAFGQYAWVKKILYKPNTSTLHRIGDLLCVFNTTDGTLELYTLMGEFASKLKAPVESIIGKGRWTKEIYVDQVGQAAYTSFIKGGEFFLYRININTGELTHILATTHGFPQKVKVCNRHLFYLYDLPGRSDNKYMFRQKL